MTVAGQVLRGLFNLLRTAMMNPGKVARIAGPYIPTFAGFLAFLKWNGGIVLGEQTFSDPSSCRLNPSFTPYAQSVASYSGMTLPPSLPQRVCGSSSFHRRNISQFIICHHGISPSGAGTKLGLQPTFRIQYVVADPSGHRELHQPVLHFPQLLYFLAFSTALCFPAVVAPDPLCALRGALRLGVGSVR